MYLLHTFSLCFYITLYITKSIKYKHKKGDTYFTYFAGNITTVTKGLGISTGMKLLTSSLVKLRFSTDTIYAEQANRQKIAQEA